jgi:hypothetical protein
LAAAGLAAVGRSRKTERESQQHQKKSAEKGREREVGREREEPPLFPQGDMEVITWVRNSAQFNNPNP